jgi:sulfatase maturation enzyme AslB (radical SAM superfamily)
MNPIQKEEIKTRLARAFHDRAIPLHITIDGALEELHNAYRQEYPDLTMDDMKNAFAAIFLEEFK